MRIVKKRKKRKNTGGEHPVTCLDNGSLTCYKKVRGFFHRFVYNSMKDMEGGRRRERLGDSGAAASEG